MATKTVRTNGGQQLNNGNKQLVIDKELKKQLIKEFKTWMKSNNQSPNDYRFLDARFRLAGLVSFGQKPTWHAD